MALLPQAPSYVEGDLFGHGFQTNTLFPLIMRKSPTGFPVFVLDTNGVVYQGDGSSLPTATSGAGAYTPGSILFAGSNGSPTQDNANLFYDSTNKTARVGPSVTGLVLPTATSLVLSRNGPNVLQMLEASNDTFTNGFWGWKARGTLSAPSATLVNDQLLQIVGKGFGTTGYLSDGARILFNAAETMTDAASGTYMTFFTVPTGQLSAIEAMRIDSSQRVGINTTPTAGGGTTQLGSTASIAGSASLFVSAFQIPTGSSTFTGATAQTGDVYSAYLQSPSLSASPATGTFQVATLRVDGPIPGSGVSFSPTRPAVLVTTGSAANVGIEIRGVASQNGNLLTVNDNTTAVLAGIRSTGTGFFGDGVLATPGIGFAQELSGLFRAAAGDIRMGVTGTFVMNWTTTTVGLAEGINLSLGTSTGSKIGTSASQKLSFFGATAIVQPTTAVSAATFVANTSGILNDSATWDGYTIGKVVKALRNLGILA